MIINLFVLNLKWVLRDRILQALLAVSMLLLLFVPAFSSFSMRQMQEVSITLSLSFISFVLLVFSTLLGASSVWRDIEKRYSSAVLSLPQGRGAYLLGKFSAMAAFILASAAILGAVAAIAIVISTAQYPSTTPVQWGKILIAVLSDSLKYVLLAAVALLFSSLSTSFFLPFYGTISIYLAGSASQGVFEYLSGEHAVRFSKSALYLMKTVYYIIPNFGAFDLKLQAVYPLPLSPAGLAYNLLYFLIYTTLLLALSVWIFSRRELP